MDLEKLNIDLSDCLNPTSDEQLPAPTLQEDGSRVLDSPFVILVDSNEYSKNHHGFTFQNIIGDFRDARAHIRVRTRTTRLKVADYSIEGMQGICIERKSHADLFSSMHNKEMRENFVERLGKMNANYEWSAVVIECSMSDIHNVPLEHTSLNPLSVIRSTFSWAQQFPRVHWLWNDSREMAEAMTYRLLEMFFRHKVDEKYKHHNKPIQENIEAFRQGQLTRMALNEAEIPYPKGCELRKSWMQGWGFYSLHFLGGDLGSVVEYGTIPVSGETKAEAKKRLKKVKTEEGKYKPLVGQKSLLESSNPIDELKSVVGTQYFQEK